ncbi:hypothetical protein N7490_004945 [Penicillium lividum]|nr:hypothetical protein N7490_004945 [Penicillium lividum]
MSPAAVVQASAKTDGQRQKSGRMEEWAQYPLQDWTGMERWMTGVSDQFMTERYPIEAFGEPWGRTDPPTTSQNSNQAQSPADGETQGASPGYAGQPPGDDHFQSSHDIHFCPGRMSFSACSQDAVVGSDVATGDEHTDVGASNDQRATGHSRAEELSKSKSSIYF